MRRVLSIAILLTTPTGCGQKKAVTELDLRLIGIRYSFLNDVQNKPPTRVEDFDKTDGLGDERFPAIKKMIRDGEYVVLWSVPTTRLHRANKSGDVVICYEKRVPASGGLVLMGDGQVKEMTANEFAAAIATADKTIAELPQPGKNKFPELRPTMTAPKGFEWSVKDRPDSYTWKLSNPDELDGAPASGIEIYVGLHPTQPPTDAKLHRKPGNIAGKEVTWLDDFSDDSGDSRRRRNAYLDYRHSPDHIELKLHFGCGAIRKSNSRNWWRRWRR